MVSDWPCTGASMVPFPPRCPRPTRSPRPAPPQTSPWQSVGPATCSLVVRSQPVPVRQVVRPSTNLVTQATGLVRARGAGSTVADVELPVLPAADAEQEPEDVRLLALVQLGDVLRREGAKSALPLNRDEA